MQIIQNNKFLIAEIDENGKIKNDGSVKPVGKQNPLYIEEKNQETFALIKKKTAFTSKERNRQHKQGDIDVI